jgi:hypothetical protein
MRYATESQKCAKLLLNQQVRVETEVGIEVETAICNKLLVPTANPRAE